MPQCLEFTVSSCASWLTLCGSACPHNWCFLRTQAVLQAPPEHDSQLRLSVQMMTVTTGHCTHLAHVPSSAQVTAVGAFWHISWVLTGVLCCLAQVDQPLTAP